MNKLFNEDINFFLNNNVNDESVDLIIADPPYNVLNEKWDTFKTDDEYFLFMEKWLTNSYKKLKDGGTIYLFNNSYNSAKLIPILENIGYIFIDWIIWYKKDGFNNTKNKYVNNQETILFLSKGIKKTFNFEQIRVDYDSQERMVHASKKGILKNGKRWFPNENGKLCTNVWEFSSDRHQNKKDGKIIKNDHPTPKPLKMIERMILASSNPEELILDLFSGTGTTTVASQIHNRNSIGCELNKDYFLKSIQRIGEEKENS